MNSQGSWRLKPVVRNKTQQSVYVAFIRPGPVLGIGSIRFDEPARRGSINVTRYKFVHDVLVHFSDDNPCTVALP